MDRTGDLTRVTSRVFTITAQRWPLATSEARLITEQLRTVGSVALGAVRIRN